MSETALEAAGPVTAPGEPVTPASKSLFRVLVAISFCHLLNDMVQSLLPSIYPILKSSFHLDFAHLGLLTLTDATGAVVMQAQF